MEVLLRKASSLARACSEEAAKIAINPKLTISVHAVDGDHAVAALLTETASKMAKNIAAILDLHEARRAIREAIGVANAEKVDRLLTERDYLNMVEKTLIGMLDESDDNSRHHYYSSSSVVEVEHDAAKATVVLASLRMRLAATTSDTVTQVSVPTNTPAMVEQYKKKIAEIKRRRLDLMDELAFANLNQKIRLSGKVVAILQAHGILEPA